MQIACRKVSPQKFVKTLSCLTILFTFSLFDTMIVNLFLFSFQLYILLVPLKIIQPILINYLSMKQTSLLLDSTIICNNNFLDHSINFLKSSLPNLVKSLFHEFIQNSFPLFILIYTNSLVSPISAGFSFFISVLHIFFNSNLPPVASSYTSVCFTTIETIKLISTLQPNKFLIFFDFFSDLQSLSSNILNSLFSPLMFSSCIFFSRSLIWASYNCRD